jgi:hypothetical protein
MAHAVSFSIPERKLGKRDIVFPRARRWFAVRVALEDAR